MSEDIAGEADVSGQRDPTDFNCVTEIPRGRKLKYDLDKAPILIKAYCETNNPMDMLFLMQEEVVPGCFRACASGLMPMIVQDEKDYKIIDVCAHDQELSWHHLQEICRFFGYLKKNETEEVAVNDFITAEDVTIVIKYSSNLSRVTQTTYLLKGSTSTYVSSKET